MTTIEQRPVLGIDIIGGSNSVYVTLFTPLNEGFVPINRVPRPDGTVETIGTSAIVQGQSGPEIVWRLPIGSRPAIEKLVSGYIAANGATPEALRKLQMLH